MNGQKIMQKKFKKGVERMKYDLIKVDWFDVMSMDTALVYPDDLNNVNPCMASIVGFLVKETKEAYFLAKEVWVTGQAKYIHVIPKKTAIIKITKLKELKE
jgi:hypothetical protein